MLHIDDRASAGRYTTARVAIAAIIAGAALAMLPISSASATTHLTSHGDTLEGTAPGATVIATIDPVGQAFKPGTTFPTMTLATVHVTDGRFTMTLADRAAVTRWAAVNNGNVNVQLTSATRTTSRMTMVTYRADRGQLVALETPTVRWGPTVNLGYHPADTHPVECDYTTISTSTSQGRIGEAEDNRNSSGSFVYGRVADSSVGVSFDGSNASAGSSGTVTISNSESSALTYPVPTHFEHYLLTNFSGATYRTDPPGSGNEYCENPGGKSQATSWLGGDADGASFATPQYHEYGGVYPCLVGDDQTTESYLGGSRLETGKETAWTFDSGLTFTFPGVGTVGMSTHQGFSSYTSDVINFGNADSYNFACGLNQQAINAQEIFTGPALNSTAGG